MRSLFGSYASHGAARQWLTAKLNFDSALNADSALPDDLSVSEWRQRLAKADELNLLADMYLRGSNSPFRLARPAGKAEETDVVEVVGDIPSKRLPDFEVFESAKRHFRRSSEFTDYRYFAGER